MLGETGWRLRRLGKKDAEADATKTAGSTVRMADHPPPSWLLFLRRAAAAHRAGRPLAPEDADRFAAAAAAVIDHGAFGIDAALELPTDLRRLAIEHRLGALQILARPGSERAVAREIERELRIYRAS